MNENKERAKRIAEKIAGSPVGTIVLDILEELESAAKKFPEWPTDPIHAAAVIAEEAGEAVKESLQLTYEPEKRGASVFALKIELRHTAAMAIRALASADLYEPEKKWKPDNL